MNASARRLRGGSARVNRAIFDGVGALVPSLEPRLMMAADVLTYHNDNQRDGANLKETILTPQNVNVNTFGKIGSVAVDGDVYAQPLVKTDVTIPGKGVHNVLYVATENDSLYAFDANTLKLLWHDSFIAPPKIIPQPSITSDIYPTFGITSTPVIDPKTNTIYVVSTVVENATTKPQVVQQLHAINIATGKEKHAPADLQAQAPGTGPGSVNGVITYDPYYQNQRAALLLSNGVIYIASSSYSSQGPYHGWVLQYNAKTLKQVGAFIDTPNGDMGGTWMSGDGPAADSEGNVYFTTGNGTYNTDSDYGDTAVKLTNGVVSDSFTPTDQAYLYAQDKDLGSGGVVVLPPQAGSAATPDLLVAAGKSGTIYLLNRDNMGGYTPPKSAAAIAGTVDPTVSAAAAGTTSNLGAVQSLYNAIPYAFDTPAYFNNTLYYAGGPAHGPSNNGVTGTLQAFSIANAEIDPTSVDGPTTYGWPGATPSVSANGTKNGIVWTQDGSDYSTTPGVLRAYNAANITQEIYNSTEAPDGRDLGAAPYNKFTPPTVANGKVYVAGKGAITMYGLLPKTKATKKS